MTRRALAPFALLVLVLTFRAAGCRQKSTGAPKPAATPAARSWMTPLMTPVPPKPTITVRPGVTRVPALPE